MQIAMQLGRQTLLPGRTVDWIKENGRCLDNIYPHPSTLRQAGQGAFASRSMSAGETIAPIPTMIQVTNLTSLDIFQMGYYVDEFQNVQARKNSSNPVSQQLLINYCFGHDNSSLLLCPASNANLINHCSQRLKRAEGQCNPLKGPNAYLRWATDFDPETSDWLKFTIEEIDERVKLGRRGISLEVVATSDIQKDEGKFLQAMDLFIPIPSSFCVTLVFYLFFSIQLQKYLLIMGYHGKTHGKSMWPLGLLPQSRKQNMCQLLK